MLAFTYVTKEFRNIQSLNLLYNRLVHRPELENCVSAWSPHHPIHIITFERVQNAFTRNVFYRTKQPYLHYQERLKKINQLTVP